MEKDEYNKTIEDLKFSYEKRIRSLEDNIEIQQKNNLESLKQKDTTINVLKKDLDNANAENKTFKEKASELLSIKILELKLSNIIPLQDLNKLIIDKYITIDRTTESQSEQNIKGELIKIFTENNLGNISRSLPQKTVFKFNSNGIEILKRLNY